MALLLLSGNNVLAQNYKFTMFNTSDGLPSPETYFVHEDFNGYIWIGTDRGLSRYDGYSFINYTTVNSALTCNTVFKCYERENKDLWFTCYDGSITIFNFKNQRFTPFGFNDSLKTWFQYWPKRVDFYKDYAIIYGYNDNYNFTKYSFETDNVEFHVIENAIPIGNFYSKSKKHDITLFKKTIEGKNIYFTDKVDFVKKESQYARRLIENVQIFKGTPLMYDDYSVYTLAKDSIRLFKTFNEPIQFIYSKQSSSELLILNNKSIYRYVNHYWDKLPNSNNYSYIYEDGENNLWVCTLNNGVLRVPNLDFNTLLALSSHESIITSLHDLENDLLIGTSAEELFAYSKKNKTTKLITKFSDVPTDYRIAAINGTKTAAQCTGGFSINYNHDSTIEIEKYPNSSEFKGLHILDKHSIAYYTYRPGLNLLREGKVVNFSTDNEQLVSMNLDSKGILRCGSITGLWKMKEINGSQVFAKDTSFEFIKNRINVIQSKPPNTVIYGSGSVGLIIEKNNKYFRLHEDIGLISDVVNAMHFTSDTVLWVGTSRGISKVIIKEEIDASYVQYTLNSDDGLLSNFIYSIKSWNGFLWVGTDEGLMKIPIHQLEPNRTAPKVYIYGLTVLDTVNQVNNSILQHDANNVRINYVGICFKKPTENFYRYRLTKNDDLAGEFQYTNNTFLNFLKLNSGNYLFEISCRNKNNIWSDSQSLEFTVLPHFTETRWFRMSMSILILTILSFFLNQQINQYYHKQDKEIEIRELEYKFQESELAALRNQMNPHFVFNALNSIQAFVLDNELNTASEYIQQFSKLMRESLEYSSRNYILLEDEVGFLKNYLKIE